MLLRSSAPAQAMTLEAGDRRTCAINRERKPPRAHISWRPIAGKGRPLPIFPRKRGSGVVTTLAANSDILLENYKVGGLRRYGLDYESLKQHNPSLIYCSISGFGQTGPLRERGGYDSLIQGMTGLMSITGEATAALSRSASRFQIFWPDFTPSSPSWGRCIIARVRAPGSISISRFSTCRWRTREPGDELSGD